MKALGRAMAVALGTALAIGCSEKSTAPTEDLTIVPTSVTLVPGESQQLVTSGGPGGQATWSSSRPDVATVVEVTGFVEALAPGTSTITAQAGGESATATVEVVPPPLITLGTAIVELEVVEGEEDPEPVEVAVTNDGGKTLSGLTLGTPTSGGQPTDWLSVSLAGSEAPTTIEVVVEGDGLAPGVYTASVPVLAPGAANSPQQLSVRFTVLSAPSIELEVGSVQLGAEPGESSGPVEIAIENGGEAPLIGLQADVQYGGGQAQGWLTATLAATTAPTTLTLEASAEGLAVGTYDATVTLSAGAAALSPGGPLRQVAPVALEVELVVTPGPAIQVSQSQLEFTAVVGDGPPPAQEVSISNGGGGELTDLSLGPVDYSGSGGWLTVQLDGTTAPATASFEVDPAGLGEGTYTASVTLASPVAENSPVTLDVSLTVVGTPTIVVSPDELTFAAVHLGANPGAQVTQVTNGGGGTLSGLQGTVTYVSGGTNWVSGGFSSGTAPSVLTIQPLTGSLPVGSHVAVVRIRSTTDPDVAPTDLTLRFEVLPSFEVDIYDFFTTSYTGFGNTPCTNCHVGGGPAPNLQDAATAYQSLVGAGRVVPGNTSQGVLLCKIKGLSGCGTAMRLPNAQISLIEAWIQSGANF